MRFWPKSAPADDPAPAPPITTLTRRAPDWPSLPSIQRIVTSIAPIADRAGFEHSLRTHQDPSFLAPLAHLVDPDGPSGRIGGLVTPAPTSTASVPAANPGVVQRWPQRGLGGPVISRSADPGPAPADARSEAIEGPRAEAPAPAAAPAEVQRALAPTDPAEMQRATSPTDPVAVQRDSAPSGSLEPRGVPEVRTAPVLSDRQPATAPVLQQAAPAAPVQRSLVRAPEPEPMFRTLPVVARTADADATPDESTETGAAWISESEPATAQDVPPVTPPAPPPIQSGPPTTIHRSTSDAPAPVGSPEPARPTSTPTIGVQRRAAVDAIAGNAVPPTPKSETRQAPGQQPPVLQPPGLQSRELGLGAPLERTPDSAAQVEVISLQQWAAGRDTAPQVSLPSPQITAAPPPQPTTADPESLPSEAAELDFAPTLGANEPPAEQAVQRAPDAMPVGEIRMPAIPTASAESATQSVAVEPAAVESVGLVGQRPSLLETIADPASPSAADPASPSAADPASPSVADPASPSVADLSTRSAATPSFAPPSPAGSTPATTAAVVQRHRESLIPSRQDSAAAPNVSMESGASAVHRLSPTPLPAVTLPTTPSPSPSPSPSLVQRLVDDPQAAPMTLLSATATPGRAERAAETAAPTYPTAAVQRFDRSGPTASTPRSVMTPASPAAASGRPSWDTGSIAVAAGIAHRDADGSVVFAVPHNPPRVTTVQRAVEVDEMTVDNTEPAATPAPAGPDASAPTASTPASVSPAAGGPAAAAGAMPNLDELARRLYDPLAARIKAELRLDRERFGLVTDLRRP
jgi:hypothetical protein